MNHAFPGAPRGDEPQWVQLPLPRIRGLPGAQPAPLGSVHPQLPLDASACHFQPSKNRQALPKGSDGPSSHCGPRTAPGTAASPPVMLPNGRKPKAWFPEAVPFHAAAASDQLPVIQPLMQGQHRPVPCGGSQQGTQSALQTKCPGGSRRPVPTAAFILEVPCG